MRTPAIAGFFLLFACANSIGAAEYDEVKKASPLQQFAMEPFKESQGHIPVFFNTITGILDRFGEPITKGQSKFPDRTSDAVMTSYMLQYDGLVFGVIESEDKKHSWLETIIISGNAYDLKYGLAIGSTYSETVSLFQLPPPDYRAKGSPMHLYAEVIGYWANYKDESGQPKWVVADISVDIHFNAADRVEKIVLGSYED